MTTTPATTAINLLALAAPALLLIWIATLIALAIWHRRINNTPIHTRADAITKATQSRTHARAMIAAHALAAVVITAAFGLLVWPTALAAVPLLILPALGIRKWARTARTLTRILKADTTDREQLTR